MEKLKLEDVIIDIDSIPKEEIKEGVPHPFWSNIESPHIKSAMVLCILNTLRIPNIETLSDTQCRTVLARCQAYVSMLDLSDVLKNATRNSGVDNVDGLPSDIEY